MKNVIVLSICFFGIFFAFNTSQALQTNSHGIQGYINLGCLYGMFAAFSIIGPKIVAMVGPKYSMIIGGVTYALVVASNFSNQSYVQIIANLLVGVGAAMLWNAEGVYIGRCAVWDSRTSTKSFAETTSSFNGVFYSIFQFSGCAGTLIGGLIMQFFKDKPNLLFTVMTIVGSLFVLTLFVLPNVPAYTAGGVPAENDDDVSFNETFALLFHSLKLVLMLPIIIYNGMSLAYIFGDVTSGISKRCFGASWSLYITAIFYLANSFASYIFGKCVEKKWMSRTVMCCAAFVMQLISFLFFIFYKIPNDSKSITDLILTIVMVILLSFGDSVWESQPPAILQSFYGLDRERNAAMANYKMWQSLGWCGQFVVGVFFSTAEYIPMKSSILLGLLVVSYIVLVILDRRYAKLDMKKGESAALLAGEPTMA